MNDERMGTLLVEALRTLPTPTEQIVSGAMARGRRRRRIVRIAESLTIAAVCAGVAGLVIALLPRDEGSGSTTPPGGHDSSATTAPDVPITPQALLQTALDTLPRPGQTTRYAGESTPGFVSAQFDYDDGHGAAKVAVSMDYPPLGAGLGSACEISDCTTRPDGSRLAVYQGNGRPGDPNLPGKDWQVSLLRTDGVVVSITEWNAAEEKASPTTRPEPPFTIAELTEWVGLPRWRVQISAEYASSTARLFRVVDDSASSPATDAAQRCRLIAKEERASNLPSTRLAALRQQAHRLGC
jgi:hypothetical protein